jgi:hypothetical protein
MRRFFFIALGFILLPSFVFAQSASLDTVGAASGLSNTPLPVIIGNIINVFLGLLGVIFLVLVIYAGFTWMTAGGDETKVKRAKDTLIRAVVGLIITLSAYAITAFIFNALENAGIIDGRGQGGDPFIPRSVPFSNSLGNGGIVDHYPVRNARDVARNTSILFTFSRPVELSQWIEGYSDNGTPLNYDDDTVPADATYAGDILSILEGADGPALNPADFRISYTEPADENGDQTIVLTQVANTSNAYLGSSVEDTLYTVEIDDAVQDIAGNSLIDRGGYRWSFTVGTSIDLTPPNVTSVIPRPDSEHPRNTVVEINFSEAMMPLTTSGVYSIDDEEDDRFDFISVDGSGFVEGEYVLSNAYRTVTFVTNSLCGTNACGDEVFCLPGNENLDVNVLAATMGSNPPQALLPYDGVTDVSNNALDGNGDGQGGDNYSFAFSTGDLIDLSPPTLLSIGPDIEEENVVIDAPVELTFDEYLMTSTISQEAIRFVVNPFHELWYFTRSESVDVTVDGAERGVTKVSLPHGVFERAPDGEDSYVYDILATSALKDSQQNCFLPTAGPNASGGVCTPTADEPYCCNGILSANACIPIN